jgi:predicted Zn-ribbon and HTH transcriptional regulator
MSICGDGFGAEGQFKRLESHHVKSRRINLYQVQCHNCSYDSGDPIAMPDTCPKCGGHA